MIKLEGLSRRKQFLLAYVVLLFFSGIFHNPLYALVVGFVYWVGLVGLVTLIDARLRVENKFLYGFLGVSLLFISWVWLEILIQL